jgi:hypothetical protein
MAGFNLERGWENASAEVKRKRIAEFVKDEDVRGVVAQAVAADEATATSALKEIADKQPEAVAAGWRDRDTRASFAHAARKVEQEVVTKHRRDAETDPTERQLDEASAGLELESSMVTIRRELAKIRDDILPRLSEARLESMRVMLNGLVLEIIEGIKPIQSLAETGETDLNRFLRDTLSKG